MENSILDIFMKQFNIPEYNKSDELKELNYLEKNIYKGLNNLNNGFDAESIFYFNESDFEIVLDRVEKLGIEIMGIEPWLDGEYYDVRVAEEYKSSQAKKWPRKVFSEFKKKKKNLQYSASYKIPKEFLNDDNTDLLSLEE